MPDPRPAPGVYDSLFGDLPPDWRERRGLPPAPQPQAGKAGANAPDTPGKPPQRAGAPKSPWQFSRSSWFTVAKQTVHEIGADRVTSVAGGVSYFGLLALFPAITALVSIYGMIADESTMVDNIAMLNRFLPDSAVELIAGQIQAIVSAPNSALSLAGIISILLALWTANGGMKALIEALNVAWYETEKRGFIRLNLESLALTLGAIALIILMVVTITVLPVLARIFFPEGFAGQLVSLLRWPLMFAVLLLALAVLYRVGPSKNDPEWQWISPGALFAAIGLVVASLLFSWYAANFANYNETYGSLSAAIVLMVWLWIAAIVVMIGAELNSEAERQMKIENGVIPQDERNRQKRREAEDAGEKKTGDPMDH